MSRILNLRIASGLNTAAAVPLGIYSDVLIERGYYIEGAGIGVATSLFIGAAAVALYNSFDNSQDSPSC